MNTFMKGYGDILAKLNSVSISDEAKEEILKEETPNEETSGEETTTDFKEETVEEEVSQEDTYREEMEEIYDEVEEELDHPLRLKSQTLKAKETLRKKMGEIQFSQIDVDSVVSVKGIPKAFFDLVKQDPILSGLTTYGDIVEAMFCLFLEQKADKYLTKFDKVGDILKKKRTATEQYTLNAVVEMQDHLLKRVVSLQEICSNLQLAVMYLIAISQGIEAVGVYTNLSEIDYLKHNVYGGIEKLRKDAAVYRNIMRDRNGRRKK